MSVMRGPVDVQCDGCSTWDETASRDYAAETRAVLRRRGWAVNLPGGRDLCPRCRAAQ